MSKHFLYCPEVGSTFYQVSGKRMPKGMGGYVFFEVSFLSKFFNRRESGDDTFGDSNCQKVRQHFAMTNGSRVRTSGNETSMRATA